VTILVGIDDSAPSRSALSWAISRAKGSGEGVRLVHVIDDEWGQVGSAYAGAARESGAHLVADAARAVQFGARGVSVEESVLVGSPAWTLAAEATPGDLLVVGTHKTGYLHGRVLGSRSIVIASTARSSVAVIPDSPVHAGRSVIVGVAPGRWREAVSFGATEAANTGDELVLVHAVPEDSPPHAVDEARSLLSDARAFAAAQPGAPTEIRSRISRRQPASALLDAARGARMLVVSPTRGPVDRAGFVGSVTHAILLNITSPVVVAR
jgi:nucleotide-binding universal stress UspA family protein